MDDCRLAWVGRPGSKDPRGGAITRRRVIEFDLGACLSGRKNAWDAFVARFARVIYAAVCRTLRAHRPNVSAEDIQDATQDVFVRLLRDDYRLLRRFDPARSSLVTWLTIIARSAAIDYLRRLAPDAVNLDESTNELEAPQPVERLEIPANLLSERQRLVLHLLIDRGISVEEAAALLDVDAQTVRSTRHKAIQRLREHFGEDENSTPPAGMFD